VPVVSVHLVPYGGKVVRKMRKEERKLEHDDKALDGFVGEII